MVKYDLKKEYIVLDCSEIEDSNYLTFHLI